MPSTTPKTTLKTKKCPACKSEMIQGKSAVWYCPHCDFAHEPAACELCKVARGYNGTGPKTA